MKRRISISGLPVHEKVKRLKDEIEYIKKQNPHQICMNCQKRVTCVLCIEAIECKYFKHIEGDKNALLKMRTAK
jgi:hypothetical protein